MPRLCDILASGGEVEIPGGFMHKSFQFLVGGAQVGELAWERFPSGRAFFDTGEARYQISVTKKSRLTWKRTVQVERAGEVIAELHASAAGVSGVVITGAGHVYRFKRSRGRVTVTHEVGQQVVLMYAKRHVGGSRRIQVSATTIEADEFEALVALVTSHLLVMDYFHDASVAAAGASSGGAGG